MAYLLLLAPSTQVKRLNSRNEKEEERLQDCSLLSVFEISFWPVIKMIKRWAAGEMAPWSLDHPAPSYPCVHGEDAGGYQSSLTSRSASWNGKAHIQGETLPEKYGGNVLRKTSHIGLWLPQAHSCLDTTLYTFHLVCTHKWPKFNPHNMLREHISQCALCTLSLCSLYTELSLHTAGVKVLK